MICPYCGHRGSKVVNSRLSQNGEAVRRRRECDNCKRRFTTFEMVEKIPLMVIKRDGGRERFDRRKIITGMVKACEKRPVSMEQIEHLAAEVEKTLYNQMDREVSSLKIGELVLERLRGLDEIAYVRFASVYHQFKDVNEFSDEIKAILRERHYLS